MKTKVEVSFVAEPLLSHLISDAGDWAVWKVVGVARQSDPWIVGSREACESVARAMEELEGYEEELAGKVAELEAMEKELSYTRVRRYNEGYNEGHRDGREDAIEEAMALLRNRLLDVEGERLRD
jgi:flagellar biosynthesis/type III secretory pathway protein FliH